MPSPRNHFRISSHFFLFSVFLFFGFFSISFAALDEYQKIAPGGTVTLGEFVFDDDYVATTTPCTIGITDPLNTEIVPSTTPMTANDDGWHYYDYTTAGNAPLGVWNSIMTCGSVQGGDLATLDKSFVVDGSVVSTSTVKDVFDESLIGATSSLSAVISANTNTSVSSASSSLFATLPGTIWSFADRTFTSVGTLVADTASAVWSSGTRSLTTFGTLAADVWTNTVRTLTGAGLDSGSLATQADINTATSTLAAKIESGWTVTLSDFEGKVVNATYKAKVQVLNSATVPTDADSLPTVTITDADGVVQVSGATMTKDSNGTYSYFYNIPGNAVGGVWETVASVVINGETIRLIDYWTVIADEMLLTFTISGLGSGTATAGITTDVTTTATSVPFGSLAISAETEAAQRLEVTTNASAGYQLLVLQTQGFLGSGTAEIVPVDAANASPAAWAIPAAAPGAYGYHTTDATLIGGSGRFAADNTYAKFETDPKEIAYSSGPVVSETTDIVYKTQITNQQDAGLYDSRVIYIVVPVF